MKPPARTLWYYDEKDGLKAIAEDHFMADCYSLHETAAGAIDEFIAKEGEELMELREYRMTVTSKTRLYRVDRLINKKINNRRKAHGARQRIGL